MIRQIALAASFVFVLGFASGCEPAVVALPDPGPNAVTLTINAEPPGSQVIVDGIPVGNAPQTVKLRRGPHTIKGMKSGYFAAEQRITASTDSPKSVLLTLVASH